MYLLSISCDYILIQEQKTWDEARVYCRQNHFDLATIQSLEDWTLAMTSVWIGLYNDINSWRWSYQDEDITFTSWSLGEPNNGYGKQECGSMEQGKWRDVQCIEHNPFFCYDEKQTGANRFIFINSISLNWRDAQSYCRQHHTDLVIIRSQTENDQLTSMMQGFIRTWIGLFRDSWKWSDGTNVNTSSINWMTGQPDMTGLNRPCGAADSDGLIEDQFCSNVLPFICMYSAPSEVLLTCESMTAHLSCGQGIIQVLSANYGRTDRTTCSTGQPKILLSNDQCTETRSLSVMAIKCNRKTNCAIFVDYKVFRDPCSGTYKYLNVSYKCVAPPPISPPPAPPSRKMQIVRLEVKSGQNVNDPAVMETMLQLIQQKLKDHGIERNTRVRWRLQTNGNVFSPKLGRKDASDKRNPNKEDCSEL